MLTLSKKTDYALLALSDLRGLPPSEAVPARDIAERYQIPAELMAKILQRLARAGIVTSSAGKSGGYRLARAAGAISVGAVIEAIDGAPAIVHCLKSVDNLCQQYTTCTVRTPMTRINERIVQMLHLLTVEEIAGDQARATIALMPMSGTDWLPTARKQ
ncbi:MAG: Rrf2 family transcriptional regulator [Armatimonadetes bacterium]|nr:Rrf2 family transcriptional regulator [Armatimonadota bacterium]MDE2206312.1 Rrf2 family transcriptional regulator [Armatimonadota bacterium]